MNAEQIEGTTELKTLAIEGDANGGKDSEFVNAVAWSDDGSSLAVLSSAGSVVTTYETNSWQVIKRFTRFGDAYTGNSLAFLPKASLITTAASAPEFGIGNKVYKSMRLSLIYSLIRWDSVSGNIMQLFPGYRIDENGKNLMIENENLQSTDKFGISPDGALVAGIDFVANESGIRVFDAKTASIIWRATIPTDWVKASDLERMTSARWELIKCLAFSPDGTELAVGTGTIYVTSENQTYGSIRPGGGRVHVFNARTGQRLRSFWAFRNGTKVAAEFSVSQITYSPDGKTIATARGLDGNPFASQTQSLATFDARTGEPLASLPAARTFEIAGALNFDPVRTISWYGDTLISGEGAALRLWSMANPKSPRLLGTVGPPLVSSPSLYAVWSTAVSRDGRLAVGRPGAVTIYQLPSSRGVK